MEQDPCRISEADYLQLITDFSVDFIANTHPIYWPNAERRIGLVLGLGIELAANEQQAIRAGVEACRKEAFHIASEKVG